MSNKAPTQLKSVFARLQHPASERDIPMQLEPKTALTAPYEWPILQTGLSQPVVKSYAKLKCRK